METMFFMPVEIKEEVESLGGSINQYEPDMACRLEFTGDYSGTVILVIPEQLLEEMAENFMGESKEDLTKEHLSGILTESLNMICGNGLKNIESKEPFELGIPEIINTKEISEDLSFNIIRTSDCAMAMNISSL
jgi:CheY-specific phosphatase CheX